MGLSSTESVSAKRGEGGGGGERLLLSSLGGPVKQGVRGMTAHAACRLELL